MKLKNIINKSLRVLVSSAFLIGASYFINDVNSVKIKSKGHPVKEYYDKKFMNIDLLVDEEFLEKYGEDWKNKAKWFMKESEKNFHEFNISFNITSYEKYETPNNENDDELFKDLTNEWIYMCKKEKRCQFEPNNPFFIFLLTGQKYENAGGRGGPFYGKLGELRKIIGGVGFASLREDINDLDKTTIGAITHELGHILDAEHLETDKDGLILGKYPIFYIMFPSITLGKNIWHPKNKKIINKNKGDLSSN